MSHTKRINVRTALLAAVVLSIAALIIFNVRDVVLGTPLKVVSATDGATLEDTFLPIVGVAPHARELSINGRSVFIDRSGNFDDGVILSPGYNIVEVALKDRFGKQTMKTYHVVVEEREAVAQTTPSTYKQ
jgi:hypothetical protein